MSSSSNGRPLNGSPQSDFYVYQETGQPLGPVPSETLARNLLSGNLSNDAFVGIAGGSRWEPVASVPEIRDAVRRIASEPPPAMPASTAAAPPSIKPAAVAPLPWTASAPARPASPSAPAAPRTALAPPSVPATMLFTAPPPAPAPAASPSPAATAPSPAPAPSPAATAPAPAPAATAPKPAAATPAPKPADVPKLDPRYKLLPLVIFGACGGVGVIMTVITLIVR